jgi:hypothetical protein
MMLFRRLFRCIACYGATDQAEKDDLVARSKEMPEWEAFECVFCPWLIHLKLKWSDKKLERTLKNADPDKLREMVTTIEKVLAETEPDQKNDSADGSKTGDRE